jgi:hyperosmotically inducible periplasmic protein
MNFSKKLLLPLTLSSIVALSFDAVAEDKSIKQESKETWQEVKKESKETWQDVKQGSKKAWNNTQDAYSEGVIAGKLEAALILNRQLNPFEIGFDVEGTKVTLKGKVDTEIEKDLAENVTKGVDGVNKVENKILVEKSATKVSRSISADGKRSFSQYVDDASTTASIKTELLANENIKGLDINVDTFNNKVTLSGKVKTSAQKALAEAIVKKRDGVSAVVNQLTVNS